MATAINTETPASLADAAAVIGAALLSAIGTKDEASAQLLRQALSHIFAAAEEAGAREREIDRLTTYVTRVEAANSHLTGRVAEFQRRGEILVASLAPALDVIVEAFNRAGQLKSAARSAFSPTDFTRRGEVSEETLAALRSAPGMAHGG